MPGLYALKQHITLREIAARLSRGDKVYAFLDDVYITTKPARTLDALRTSQHCLACHVHAHVHLDKMRAWNAAVIRARNCVVRWPGQGGELGRLGRARQPRRQPGCRSVNAQPVPQQTRRALTKVSGAPALANSLAALSLILLYCGGLLPIPPAHAPSCTDRQVRMMRRCSHASGHWCLGGEAPMTTPYQNQRWGQLPLGMGGRGAGVRRCSPTGRLLGLLG